MFNLVIVSFLVIWSPFFFCLFSYFFSSFSICLANLVSSSNESRFTCHFGELFLVDHIRVLVMVHELWRYMLFEFSLHSLRDLFKQISIDVYVRFDPFLLLPAFLLLFHFIQIDGFDDDSVGHSLTGGETATVVLNDPTHIVGSKLFVMPSSKRNNYTMVQVVKDLVVVAGDELF